VVGDYAMTDTVECRDEPIPDEFSPVDEKEAVWVGKIPPFRVRFNRRGNQWK